MVRPCSRICDADPNLADANRDVNPVNPRTENEDRCTKFAFFAPGAYRLCRRCTVLLHKGDKGADVGRIQQLLIEAGYSVNQTEAASQTFGSDTYDAARQFQATHVDSHGHALDEDGVIGPETLWALMHGAQAQRANMFVAPGWQLASNLRPEIAPVMRWASARIGMQETPPGSNRGDQIDDWVRAAGLDPGIPWCAIFVSAAYHQAPGGSPFKWIASAYKLLEWGKKNKLVVPIGAPIIPGDICIILRASYHGHAFLCAGPADKGKICTLEGNAADACRGLIRDPSVLAGVVRPFPLSS